MATPYSLPKLDSTLPAPPGRRHFRDLPSSVAVVPLAILLACAGMLAAFVLTVMGKSSMVTIPLGAVFAGLVLANPFVGLMGFACLIALEAVLPSFLGGSWAKYLGWALFAAVGFHLLLGERMRISRNPQMLAMAALLLVMLISVQVAVAPEQAFLGVTTYLQLAALVMVVVHLVCTERRLLILTWALLVMVGLSAVGGIFQYFVGRIPRAVGFLGNPNALSLLLSVSLPFLVMFLQRARSNLVRVGIGIMLALVMTALAVTLSRGGYIAFAIGLFLSLIRFVKALRSIGGVLALTGLFMVASYFPLAVWQRAETIAPALAGNPDTMRVRYQLWQTGWEMFQDNPWLGVGLGNYRNQAPFYRPPNADRRRLVPHNMFLDMAAELGLPGLLAFLLMLLFCWQGLRQAQRRWADQPGSQLLALLYCLEISLIVCLVQGMKGSLANSKLIWLVLGLSAAATRMALILRRPNGARQPASTPSPPALGVAQQAVAEGKGG